jgi:hypothetical protein
MTCGKSAHQPQLICAKSGERFVPNSGPADNRIRRAGSFPKMLRRWGLRTIKIRRELPVQCAKLGRHHRADPPI